MTISPIGSEKGFATAILLAREGVLPLVSLFVRLQIAGGGIRSFAILIFADEPPDNAVARVRVLIGIVFISGTRDLGMSRS